MLDQMQSITRAMPSDDHRRLWKTVWKSKEILPRVKTFFWKILNNAIPTFSVLSKRLPHVQPHCTICESAIEDVAHMLFFCPHARATWFASPLGLRVEPMSHLTLHEVLNYTWNCLTPDQTATFIALAWQIWKARCAHIYQQKDCKPDHTLKQLNFGLVQFPHVTPISNTQESCLTMNDKHKCWTDGSWDELGRGGAAFILECQGELTKFELSHFEETASPFKMEACSLLMAIQAASHLQLDSCVFYSDCELLVKALNSPNGTLSLQNVDWRAYSELVRISRTLKQNNRFRCIYISREDNSRAHLLANLARLGQFSAHGATYPLFPGIC